MDKKIKDLVKRANKDLKSTSCRNTIPYCHWLETKLIEAEKQLTLTDVTTRLSFGVKVFKKDKCDIGIVRRRSNLDFNYWIVEWSDGYLSKEYGLDLNVW